MSGKIQMKIGAPRRRAQTQSIGMAPLQIGSRMPQAASDTAAGRHVEAKLRDIREFLLEQRLARNKNYFSLADIDSRVKRVDSSTSEELKARLLDDIKIEAPKDKNGNIQLRYKPEFPEVENRGQLMNVIRQFSCGASDRAVDGNTEEGFGLNRKRLEDCYKHVARDIQGLAEANEVVVFKNDQHSAEYVFPVQVNALHLCESHNTLRRVHWHIDRRVAC